MFYFKTPGKILVAVVFVVILSMVFIVGGASADDAGTLYQPVPSERIQSEVEAYRGFSEGPELVRMLRAYAGRDSCLSVHLVGSDLVFLWWCERFVMIEVAYVMEDVFD